MDRTPSPGAEVIIGTQPICHNWRGRLVHGPRSLAGRTAVVTGKPDRDGDVPLTIKGKFYSDQLDPACLTVVSEPEPVVGFAPGAWDLFHHGHSRLLERAAALCDDLVVGVASDEQLAATKGRLPVWGLAERLAVLASWGYRTAVLESPDWGTLLPTIGYRRIFKGDDWAGTDRPIPDGVELVILPRTAGVSTTALRESFA